MGSYLLDGGQYQGCHIGDINYNYYIAQHAETETAFDYNCYRSNQERVFGEGHEVYTALDVTTYIHTPGQKLNTHEQKRIPFTAVLQKSRKIMLLGDPGSGKTTTLRAIAYKVSTGALFRNEFVNGNPTLLCIHVELGRFRAPSQLSDLQCVLILICQSLHSQGAFALPPALSTVQDILSRNEVILLFDGLNEVSAEIRSACMRGIEDLAQRHPNSRCVITSRPNLVPPNESWELACICELNDQQIEIFLERYVGIEKNYSLKEILLKPGNVLIRTPLYIYFISEIYRGKIENIYECLMSQAHIVSGFVEFLFRRDSKELTIVHNRFNHSRLIGILERMAKVFHEIGHSIELTAVCQILMSSERIEKYSRENIELFIEQLCQMGFLVIDGQYVRFWHATLQEYFFSAAIARYWKGPPKGIFIPERQIKALFRDPLNHDALSYITSHLSDSEMHRVLELAFSVNPALAISWLDALSTENRLSPTVRNFIDTFGRVVQSLQRYSRLYVSSWWEAAAVCHIGALLLNLMIISDPESSQIFTESIQYLSLLLPISAGALIYARWNGLYLSAAKLPSIFGSVATIRNPWLRLQLTHIISTMSQSCWVRADIRHLAQTVRIQQIDCDPRSLLTDDESLFISIITLGYLKHKSVIRILSVIAKENNAYAIAATDALILQLRRHPAEKNAIIAVLSQLWEDRHTDWDIKRKAKAGLLLANESITHPWKHLVQRSILLGQTVAISLVVIASIVVALFSLMGTGGWAVLLLAIPVSCLSIPVIVLRDARKISARNIYGYFGEDGFSSFYYAMNSCYLPNLIKYYLFLRGRIKRNRKRINWKQLNMLELT